MDHTQISESIASGLASSARAYYSIGIQAFHSNRRESWKDFQPAIGNLAIAIELLLKSIVARKCIQFLYTNLPDELSLYLANPTALGKHFNLDRYAGDLTGFNYKAIEFDKAISMFYMLTDDGKERFRAFLSHLSKLRNQSVHGSVPYFKQYELDRLAYLSNKIFSYVADSKTHKYFWFKTDEPTEKFINGYADEMIAKVKKAVEAAEKVVKEGKAERAAISIDDWQTLVIECPICGSDAVCEGETEHEFQEDELYLTFFPEYYICESCGLKLENYEELILAGLEPSYERDSSADKERWFYENDGDPNHPY